MRLDKPTEEDRAPGVGRRRLGGSIMENRQVLYYRCPKCHRIVEKRQLFGTGCPICGWISPLKTAEKTRLEKERRGLIDVFDEKARLRIVAELPGVEEKDIRVRLDGYMLIISADTPYRAYCRKVELPCAVKGEAKATYNNGVLEVIVEK